MPTDQQGRRQLLHLHHGRLTNCKLTDSEMENAMSRNTSDKNKNRIFRNVIIVMLVAGLLATLALSGIMAKYTTERKKSVEMKSKKFHFTSNYLEEDGANYTVVDWGQGFDIDLFNYEKENLALMTNDDITYTISISDDWIYTVDGKTSTSYTMEESSTRTSDTIHVKPTNAITQGSVTVTVTTTSPFEKTLSATFTVSGKKSPVLGSFLLVTAESTTVSPYLTRQALDACFAILPISIFRGLPLNSNSNTFSITIFPPSIFS